MATQYGAAIRAPAKKNNISSNDPQQQALLDAMGQNGAPDPNQSIDQLPSYQTAGPSRTTMPVSVNQPQQPQQSVSGGVNGGIGSSGGLTPMTPEQSLKALAPPATGGLSAQYPNISPLQLSQEQNRQMQAAALAYTEFNPTANPNAAGGLGQFAGSMQGFDAGKLNDPNKHDPKYDFARTASQFDPRQGVTPDMLAKLNALGDGTWGSGGGDNLSFNGQSIDAIQGYKGGNGQWAWQPEDAGGAAPQQGATGAAPQGDPLTQLSQLQSQASGGDSYSALVLKYLMQQLGLDQGMLQNSQ